LVSYELPIVHSTVNVPTGINKPPIATLRKVLDKVPTYDRTSINTWEDVEFRKVAYYSNPKFNERMVRLRVWVKQHPRQEADMLAQEVLLQLQKYNFDLLARQEPSGRRRLRYMALAHIKDGKSACETALALRVTPRAVSQWLRAHGPASCGSSNQSLLISLGPCARSAMQQSVSCCLLQIPRPWRFTWKQSVKLCRQAGMLC
jgi:hypothetical protein